MMKLQWFLKFALISGVSALSGNSPAAVLEGITVNTNKCQEAYEDTVDTEDPNIDPVWSGIVPDLQGVPYADDSERQWLNVYFPDDNGSAQPHKVFLWAHANGSNACNINQSMINNITDEGFAIVSWESLYSVGSEPQVQTARDDAALALEFVKRNARNTQLNFDVNNIVIAGRSRGSGISWVVAHSEDDAIKGIYMPQAMPDPFWPDFLSPATGKPLTGEDPLIYVDEDSKPIYMPYKTPKNSTDIHDPERGYVIEAEYVGNGLGDFVTVVEDVSDSGLFDFFPGFSQTLEYSPAGFFDDFSGPAIDSSYTSINGDWNITGVDVLQNSDTSKPAFLINGSENWADYSVAARLKTQGTVDPAAKWQVARVVGRLVSNNNYYEAFLRANGKLVLKVVSSESGADLLDVVETGIDPTQWNRLEMRFQGEQIEVSVNGTAYISVSDSTHQNGLAGVRAVYCECLFDDLDIVLN